jgi:hypothetical protein
MTGGMTFSAATVAFDLCDTSSQDLDLLRGTEG